MRELGRLTSHTIRPPQNWNGEGKAIVYIATLKADVVASCTVDPFYQQKLVSFNVNVGQC